jgi:hypothetical protein
MMAERNRLHPDEEAPAIPAVDAAPVQVSNAQFSQVLRGLHT